MGISRGLNSIKLIKNKVTPVSTAVSPNMEDQTSYLSSTAAVVPAELVSPVENMGLLPELSVDDELEYHRLSTEFFQNYTAREILSFESTNSMRLPVRGHKDLADSMVQEGLLVPVKSKTKGTDFVRTMKGYKLYNLHYMKETISKFSMNKTDPLDTRSVDIVETGGRSFKYGKDTVIFRGTPSNGNILVFPSERTPMGKIEAMGKNKEDSERVHFAKKKINEFTTMANIALKPLFDRHNETHCAANFQGKNVFVKIPPREIEALVNYYNDAGLEFRICEKDVVEAEQKAIAEINKRKANPPGTYYSYSNLGYYGCLPIQVAVFKDNQFVYNTKGTIATENTGAYQSLASHSPIASNIYKDINDTIKNLMNLGRL